VCDYIYVRVDEEHIIEDKEIEEIQEIPGIQGIDPSTVCWTFAIEVGGRDPEEVKEDIKEIIPIQEARVLHGL